MKASGLDEVPSAAKVGRFKCNDSAFNDGDNWCTNQHDSWAVITVRLPE